MASKLVIYGKKPYIDFFYLQMPFLPYIYGLWLKLTGVSWLKARAFAAICSVSVGILLYYYMIKSYKSYKYALFAVSLYSLNLMVLRWFPIVKTYSLSILLLLSSYILFEISAKSKLRFLLLILSGLLLGISIGTRLYFLVVFPFYCLKLIGVKATWKKRIVSLTFFCVGMIIALFPILFFIIKAPDLFWFNNIGNHAIRVPGGLFGSVNAKMSESRELIGIAELLRWLPVIQMAVLLVISVIWGLWLLVKAGYVPLSIYITLTLLIVSFLPNPFFPQYFSILIPFLIIICIDAFNGINSEMKPFLNKFLAKRSIKYAVASLAIIYFCPFALGYLATDHFIGDLLALGTNIEILNVRDVSRKLDQLSPTPKLVISFYSGYLLESHHIIFPRMENDRGLYFFADQLSEQQRNRYHIISSSEVENEFTKRTADMVVLAGADQISKYGEILLKNGYELAATIKDIQIYKLAN